MTEPNRDELVKRLEGMIACDDIYDMPSIRAAITQLKADSRAAEALSATTGGEDLREILADAQFRHGGGGSTAIRAGHNIPIYVDVALDAMERVRRLFCPMS